MIEGEAAPSPAVSVRELTKEFEDAQGGLVRAVAGISFEARSGRILGLLGPNGAGKTTSLRVLSTALRPTSGSVSVAGFDVSREPHEVRKRIGFISGSTGLYERSTAREMVRFFGELYEIPKLRLEERIEELESWLDMGSFIDRPCGKLSTGQKQKVGIARCVVHDPPVIILDEPTSGLDILVAHQVVKFVEKEKTRGKCVIYSTHIMSEVERLCDDVAIIDRGRLVALGSLGEVVSQTGGAGIEDAFFRLVEGRRTEER